MNPFELRYSVFQTAKDFMEQSYKAQLEAFELANKTADKATDLMPSYPTLEEIIEKAIEINKFVSDNTERELGRVVKRASGIGIVF